MLCAPCALRLSCMDLSPQHSPNTDLICNSSVCVCASRGMCGTCRWALLGPVLWCVEQHALA